MTLRERMISWVGRHREAALSEVECRRKTLSTLRRLGAPAPAVYAASSQVVRADRRLEFWDDLYLRLSGAR